MTNPKCSECGKNKLRYRLVQKQRPKLERYGLIAFGIFMLIGPPLFPAITSAAKTPYSFDIYGLVAMVIGGFVIWGSFNKTNEFNLHRKIVAIDFKCNECGYEWEVKTKESNKDMLTNWDELPKGQWQNVFPGTKIPGLED